MFNYTIVDRAARITSVNYIKTVTYYSTATLPVPPPQKGNGGKDFKQKNLSGCDIFAISSIKFCQMDKENKNNEKEKQVK